LPAQQVQDPGRELGEIVSTTRGGGLTVVVTTHNRLPLLQLLVPRLLKLDGVDELIVAADGCIDGTADYLRAQAAEDDRLHPLVIEPNVGQPRARHRAVQAATSEFVLSLDDDVWPSDGLVEGHVERLRSSGADLVLGYMPTETASPRQAGQYATFEYAALYERHCLQYEKDPTTILGAFWAGNFSVRRSTYLAATEGEQFVVRYHEDKELGLRLRAVGCTAVFDRELSAVHRHSRDWSSYLAEGVNIGRARDLLADEFPEVRAEKPSERAVGSTRIVLRAARLAPLRKAVVLALRGGTQVAGGLGRFHDESRFASLAKQLMTESAMRG
jgi:glycosyltransferase involved in cell wall biosynthesis